MKTHKERVRDEGHCRLPARVGGWDVEMLGGVTQGHLPPQMGSLALVAQSGAMPPTVSQECT